MEEIEQSQEIWKKNVGFYLLISPEEDSNAITSSVLWKIHGLFYRQKAFFFYSNPEIFLFVLLFSLINHVLI